MFCDFWFEILVKYAIVCMYILCMCCKYMYSKNIRFMIYILYSSKLLTQLQICTRVFKYDVIIINFNL